MKSRKLFSMFWVIVLVSFLGFCVENIWLSVVFGYVDNRNMCLPFLLGYGLAMVAIYAMFGTPKQPRFFAICIRLESGVLRTLIYWMFTCLCVMIGEIALGTFVEKVCDIIWWDYTTLPLHITKYTSIPTTIAFGTLITAFMGIFFSPIYTYFSQHQSKAMAIAACLFMILLVIDFSKSAIQMY